MKIIDEKGRLFGKINVIDFMVVLFLLSLTRCFISGIRSLIKSPHCLRLRPRPPWNLSLKSN